MTNTWKSTMSTPKFFRLERLFLKYGGLSVEESESNLYKAYSIIVMCVFIVPYPYLLLFDLMNQAKFKGALATWFYPLGILMDSTIFINVFFIRKSFEKALRTFEMPSFYASQFRGAYEEEKKTLQDWLAISIKQNYTFTIPALCVCLSQVLYSLIWRIVKSNPNDWVLPWGSMTLINFRVSPNFEILWFYQSAVFIILCIDIIPMVMIIIGSLSFLTVQLKMLQNYLRRIIDLAKEQTDEGPSDNSGPSWRYLNEYFNYAIEYHLDIINAAKAIENVLHGVFLSFFMFTLSFLCVNIYRASLLDTNDMKILEIVTSSLTVLFPTLIICFYGEELAYESEQVGIVAYQMDFVGLDVRFQKSLILLIARSQDTLQIKAGRMISASMNTAVWIIRSAFSAYMMLRTVNANEEVD